MLLNGKRYLIYFKTTAKESSLRWCGKFMVLIPRETLWFLLKSVCDYLDLSGSQSHRQPHGSQMLNPYHLKAGFHMIADDRRKFCDHMEKHFCDRLRSSAILRSWSQTIAEDRTMFYRLRSFAILRSYGNQSSAICDGNVSHNIFNSDRWFNASKTKSPNVRF